MKKTREEVESSTLKYLEDKYNENFTIKQSIPFSVDIQYDEIIATADKFPNHKIKIYREESEDLGITFKDNYFGILKKEEYDKLLENKITSIFSNFKCYSVFMASFFKEEYKQDTKLMDVMKNDKKALMATIRVIIDKKTLSEDTMQDKAQQLFKILEENNVVGIVYIFYIDSTLFNDVNEDNCSSILVKNEDKINKISYVIK